MKKIFLELGFILLVSTVGLIVQYLANKYDFDSNSILKILVISYKFIIKNKFGIKKKQNEINYSFKILFLSKRK